MEAWALVLAAYSTTWIMLIGRTFFIIRHLLILRKETYITQYPKLHFLVYSFGMLFMTPFIWHVALFDESRKKWCLAYADAVMGKRK